MRLRKSESQIREEESGGRGRSRSGSRGISFSSSGFNASPPSFSCIHQQIQIQSQSSYYTQNELQKLTHLQIQIPPPPPPPHQPHFHFLLQQPISNFPLKSQSKPHKRPTIMNLTPPSLSHSPALSSFCSETAKSKLSTYPFGSSYSIKTLTCKIRFHFSHARLFCIYWQVLVLISLPSFFLFLSNPHGFFILNLLSILAFLITILVSLSLALPRLPSIRLLLARSLPKIISSTRLVSQASKKSKPVIWSIGSRPEVEKKPISGSWVQVYRNGDVYEGEFHQGKCSGSGVYYYSWSGRYEGDWIDEKYDGYGVETWAKGSRYRGQYRRGLRHGIGVYRFYAGDVYSGEWSNGQCHGYGIHTCEDGSKYVGEFKWGVKHGFGRYNFRNGDTYAGEYFADKMHGFGVYQFANGHRYEGAWHEGRRQGLGMYTFRDGEAQSGHWKNGVLDVPNADDSLPVSPCTLSHSKVLNAVQDAKRAAEKACQVPSADEMVRKTVIAANKAATAARVAAVKAVQKNAS